jgi:L-alanine-DL-glutamate epimerase-like enolase superfamily enzyme
MKDLNIEHCEAPIHSGNLMHLARLREISPIAIMGDEAVFSHLDAFQTLSRGCIDLINIKLGKSGGICHAMKIAGIAEAFGVYCQVGSFSESRLGITALTHFSMAWDNIIYFDLDSPLMQSEDPIIGGMTYHKDWQVTVSDEPGIGADYDPDFLKRFETLSIE